MSRRLLGPIGGPIAFFLVAALVFGGLGWVTYSALRVEQAQRESAARAELGNSLRIALWRLDGSMLPDLVGENTRPYADYAPLDPALTPLVAAAPREWMKLHFQLDPTDGWHSPQVLSSEINDRVRQVRADAAPPKLASERAAVLDYLKFCCPARDTCDAFAATDRAIPDSVAAVTGPPTVATPPDPPRSEPTANLPQAPLLPPTMTEPPPQVVAPPLPGLGGAGAKLDNTDPFTLFGWELGTRTDPLVTNLAQKGVPDNANNRLNSQALNSQAPGVTSRGGRMGPRDADKDTANDYEYGKRVGVVDRAMQTKQQAEHQTPRVPFPNFGQNSLPPHDPRMQGGGAGGGGFGNSTTNGAFGGAPTVGPGAGGFPGGPPGPGGPGGFGPGISNPPPGPGGDSKDEHSKGGKGVKDPAPPTGKPGPGDEAGKDRGPTPDVYQMESKALAQEKWDAAQAANLLRLRNAGLDGTNAAFTLEAHGWFERLGNERFRRVLDELKERPREPDKNAEALPVPVIPGMMPPPAPDMPMMPSAVAPLSVQLGSMRPLWVTAPDGSEMLVLVRAARVDGKTVYQGVVLDWEKLQSALKYEVMDLFPEAKLTAVKDAAVISTDRAMTALPVELDPGPEPPLGPAGWTPLRMGLVLAWIAAVIAFAAVGFTGWSLIDLAERRFRFVSAVTHELRTPLTSLRLYLDLLVSGMIQDEAKRQEYLSTLTMESDRLHRLIDNVLDYAKLEKRKKNGDMKPIAVTALLDQLRQTWTDRVAQDGKELVVISTLPPECEVTTDAAMIQQIVGNLIDNARKYTRDAADKRIWVWAKPGVGSAVLLEVEDRGPGVPASERKSIFKPFRRGDAADSKAGGAGLGLALAKSWAEVLGARLTYRPADGDTGACFRLELPGK